ncbi:MAG: glycine cleavage system protein R [Anaerolineae bacterium]
MRQHLVLTISGHDRPGIVDHVAKLLLTYDGNIEASRMARLGGEFAMLMLVSVPQKNFDALREGVRQLRDEDFKVTTRPTERGYAARYAGWVPFEVVARGADHEGIIHQLTHYLAGQNVNVETMDTEVVKAPMSGTPLLRLTAIVLVPPDLSHHDLRRALEDLGDDLGVDTDIKPYVQ